MVDRHKSLNETVKDIYKYTELKTDVNRNMINSVYSRNPDNFRENSEDVKKIMQNNMAWPRGYVPKKKRIRKIVVPVNQEEIRKLEVKEKHRSNLHRLFSHQIDGIITNIPKVCETQNAIVTYKQAGWKSTFMKYKQGIIDEKKKAEDALRLRLSKQIFAIYLKNQPNKLFERMFVPKHSPPKKQEEIKEEDEDESVSDIAKA